MEMSRLTRLAKPNSQARTGTGEYYFPFSADHEQEWQPYPVDPYSAICDDHTYTYNESIKTKARQKNDKKKGK